MTLFLLVSQENAPWPTPVGSAIPRRVRRATVRTRDLPSLCPGRSRGKALNGAKGVTIQHTISDGSGTSSAWFRIFVENGGNASQLC
jgi:hypothetical protein